MKGVDEKTLKAIRKTINRERERKQQSKKDEKVRKDLKPKATETKLST